MAQSFQQTIEIPLLPFRRIGCAGSASSSGASVEKTAVSHIALVRGCRRGEHVLVDAGLRACPAGSTGAVVEKTVEIPQLQPVDAQPRLCRSAGSTGAVCEETVEIPLLPLVHAGVAVHCHHNHHTP